EAAPLPDRVAVYAVVMADDAPPRVDDLAARGPLVFPPLGFQVALDEARVVAVGHESNLLRLLLLRDVEVVPPRDLAHFWFRHLAEREQGARELILRQLPEEVGLILARVKPAQEPVTLRRLVEAHARVVARRDLGTPDAQRRAVERGELHA